MTVYIVDTNILFSAILSPTGSIARFLRNLESYNICLKALTFLRKEFDHLYPKLIQLTGQEVEEVQAAENLFEHLDFVEDQTIPIAHFARAFKLIGAIDRDDLSFVALSISEDEFLLTGDRKLARGLLDKGYEKVISFSELKEKHNIK